LQMHYTEHFIFAHPYSSWECGANENTNGPLRQYVKKGLT
jgi:IS30 family transposase